MFSFYRLGLPINKLNSRKRDVTKNAKTFNSKAEVTKSTNSKKPETKLSVEKKIQPRKDEVKNSQQRVTRSSIPKPKSNKRRQVNQKEDNKVTSRTSSRAASPKTLSSSTRSSNSSKPTIHSRNTNSAKIVPKSTESPGKIGTRSSSVVPFSATDRKMTERKRLLEARKKILKQHIMKPKTTISTKNKQPARQLRSKKNKVDNEK